jgi:uncharacterized membrane protein
MKLKTFGIMMVFFVSILVLRGLLAGQGRFGFIIFNLVLAAVPLGVWWAFEQVRIKLKGKSLLLTWLICMAIWLLFLPNAFYILTDFMHLNTDVLVNARGNIARHTTTYERGDPIYMYDSLLLLLATIGGAYLGGIALLKVYTYNRAFIGHARAVIISTMAVLLSGVGIYIGRYSRWNSWQALTHPVQIITELAHDMTQQLSRQRLLITVLSTSILALLSFIAAGKLQLNKITLATPKKLIR